MKQVLKKRAAMFVLLAFSLMISVFALDGTAQAASVKLNKKKVTLAVATSTTLKVKGTTASVKWSSSKKSVATVDGKGKVTAKKKGTATITAKVGKKKLTCKVTVVNNTKTVYTKEQLYLSSTWEKIKDINDTLFCSTLKQASYDANGKLTLQIAAANLDEKKTWKLNTLSVRLMDKKGKIIAAGSFQMQGTNKLKPGEWNVWKVPLKGTNTRQVIDLRSTKFSYEVVIN